MKFTLRDVLIAVFRFMFRLAGSQGRRLLSAALSDGRSLVEIVEDIVTQRGTIRFYCLGELPLWRARTLLTKEPETIQWIDGFAEGEVYWDVGANVGAYALYAAACAKAQVLAFEPSAANYLLLNRNIELNRLSERMTAFCLAFSDSTMLDALNMQTTEFGAALSSFGVPVDNDGKTFVPSFRQGMMGLSIDDFVRIFAPPFPNHLKIDVDGIEDRIIAGAPRTLADPRLKSLSIELDAARPDYTDRVVADIEARGLRLVAKRHAEMFDTGAYRNIYNYQFRRAEA